MRSVTRGVYIHEIFPFDGARTGLPLEHPYVLSTTEVMLFLIAKQVSTIRRK